MSRASSRWRRKRASISSIPATAFLSENPALPRACERAGITFVGPSAELLELLGDKTAARKLAERAGVPVVPGHREPVDDPKQARRSPQTIGFPLIIKAAFGGGGRGMRVVESPDEFAGKLEEARREAAAAFGNGAVFLERYHPARASTSKCRSWATATATSCICTSAIAPCSGGIRK